MSSHQTRSAQSGAESEDGRDNRGGPGVLSKTLPVELVVRVFAMLPMQALIRATSICVDWREIAIGAPSLWQHFSIQLRNDFSHRGNISSGTQLTTQEDAIGRSGVIDAQGPLSDRAALSLLQLYIERSRDAPMTVRCLHNRDYAHRHMCAAILRCLLPQWHRIRALHVPAERLDEDAFQMAAPLLEELILDTPCHENGQKMPKKFLGGVQNRLHRLVFVGNVQLPTVCPALGSVKVLHGELLTEDTVSSVFSLCPQLQDVSVRWLVPTSGSTWQIVPPATLRSLKIFVRQHDNVLSILSRPILPSLRHLWIGSIAPHQLGDCRQIFDALGKIVNARLVFSDRVMIQLSLGNARGTEFTVRFGPHFGPGTNETGVWHQLSTLLESCDVTALHTLTLSESLAGILELFTLRHAPIQHLILQSFGQVDLSSRSVRIYPNRPVVLLDLQDVTFVVDPTAESLHEISLFAFFSSLITLGVTKLQRVSVRASQEEDNASLCNLPSTIWSSWSESIFSPSEHTEPGQVGPNAPSLCIFLPAQRELLKSVVEVVEVMLPVAYK